MSDEPRKRSRFDQTEAESARKSRFDRRSRSPAARNGSDGRRSRSPIAKSIESPGGLDKKDAAAAAAAAAARISASLNAKKGIQHVDVPPMQSSSSAAKSPSQPQGEGEVYQQDGDFIKDIEVNDLRNRYTLTKGNTQKMIKEKTGADVTTRGSYYPDKSMATATNPPLYLHVTSQTKEGLDRAIEEIDELMKQELPNLIDERRFRRREEPQVERDHLGRRKWPEERIPIDLEPIPGFNLRAQVVGQGGQYVKYIQQETGCRVQIKGRGSGFMEHDTGRESDEQMYLHVASPEAEKVQEAKGMCIGLLESVRAQYESFKERPPRSAGPRGSYDDQRSGGGFNRGDRNGSGSYNSNSYDANSQYGQQGGQSAYGGSAQSPTAATASSGVAALGLNPAEVEAWINYYAMNPAADPYANVGGYAYILQQAQQSGVMPGQTPTAGAAPGYAGSPQQAYNGASAYGAPPPPPPPHDDGVPPPPPPPGESSGSYSAVPPPPGM